MFLLVALVLLLVLPWPWDLVGFVVSLVLFLGALFFWSPRVRGRRKQVGAQTLIGRAATVVSACAPQGQVQVSGTGFEGLPSKVQLRTEAEFLPRFRPVRSSWVR